jgi:hypothetical protein
MASSLLNEISQFVQKETAAGFMKSLSEKGDRIAQIDNYYRQIETSIASFQVSLVYKMCRPVECNCALRCIDLGTCEHPRLAAAK